MSDATVTGYLRRLGLVDLGSPSAESLAAIHAAQVERIAYNTVDIQLGRPAPIDPADAVGRVVATGRGGYCFHLNGALSQVLTSLGFDVRRHRGGVGSGAEQTPLRPFANHLALTVHGLPTDANPGGAWFVDAGLGDALHEPLPLAAGSYRQGLFGYELEASPVLPGGWRFRHDPAGSFAAMDFEASTAEIGDFALSHRVLSTSSDSPFVQKLTVQRRDAIGVDKLVSCTLRRVEGARTVEWELPCSTEWFAALADVFGLTLDDVDADEREALWQRSFAEHERWKATRDAGR